MHNISFSETLFENDKTMYVWEEMTGPVVEQREKDKTFFEKAFL